MNGEYIDDDLTMQEEEDEMNGQFFALKKMSLQKYWKKI